MPSLPSSLFTRCCTAATVLGTLAQAQIQWTLVGSQPTTYYGALAYDAARDVTVLFGGWNGSITLAATREWNGTSWVLRTPTNAPSARSGHAMTYDAARSRVVMFGGGTSNGTVLTDTWEYDGVNWSQRATSGPTAGVLPGMAWYSSQAMTILFGGNPLNSGPATALAQTWAWDGTAWTQRFPTAQPSARQSCVLADDSRRGRLVLFGGQSATGTQNDTWEYDGSTWQPMTSPVAPPPVEAAYSCATFDPNRSRFVLRGNASVFGQAIPSNHYEWDGARWQQRTGTIPLIYAGPRMVYDSRRARCVMVSDNQTWELAVGVDVVGEGHPGGGLPLTVSSPPVAGGTMTLGFLSPVGLAMLAIGPAPAVFPPLTIGPGLFCSTAMLHPQVGLVLGVPGNPAVLSIPIPPGSAVVGTSLCMQGATLAGPCLLATDAVVATVR